jgi:glycine hydroxymethyltransferase
MAYLQRYFVTTPESERSHAAIAFFAGLDHIAQTAPSIAVAIVQELRDQRRYLKLIASENYSSLAVQFAMGNLLTDKYAEGVPFHRFYAGCDNVDAIEAEAAGELRLLFGSDHAYVQPHSGADANLVAYWSILQHEVQSPELERLGKKSIDELTPEEWEKIRAEMVSQKVMGLSLGSGGHLTHGYRHNVSARMMRGFSYDVDRETGRLNYGQIAAQVKEVKPTILVAGYSAYPGKINFAKMREIADSVGAVLMVDMAHFAGLVAGKVFTGEYDPVPYADVVTSTTHKTLRGPRGGFVLCKKEYREVVDRGCPLVLGGPLPHVIAAKAIAFKEAGRPEFQTYARQVVDNAAVLAEALQGLGCRVVTGGTENHLLLMDVTSFGLTGRQAEQVLREAHLTVNRNAIPWDPNGAWYTSGVRLGTPATTTLGMGPEEMRQIAAVIVDVLKATKPATVEKSGEASKAKYICSEADLARAKDRVAELLQPHPLYPELKADVLKDLEKEIITSHN